MQSKGWQSGAVAASLNWQAPLRQSLACTNAVCHHLNRTGAVIL